MERTFLEEIVSPDLSVVERVFWQYVDQSPLSTMVMSLNYKDATFLTDDVGRTAYTKSRLPLLEKRIDSVAHTFETFNPLLGNTFSFLDEEPVKSEVDVFDALTVGQYPIKKEYERLRGKGRPTIPLFVEFADFTYEDDIRTPVKNIQKAKIETDENVILEAFILSEGSIIVDEIDELEEEVMIDVRTTTFDGTTPCSLLEIQGYERDDVTLTKSLLVENDPALRPSGAVAA